MRRNASVLKPLSALGFVDYVPSDLVRRSFKYLLSRTISPLMARRLGFDSLPLYNMPMRAMRHFQPSLQRTMFDRNPFERTSTVFDLCRAHGLKHAVVRSDSLGLRNFFRMPDALSPVLRRSIQDIDVDTSLIYVYLHSVDILAHRHGLRAPIFSSVLASADRAIQSVIEAAKDRFGRDLEVIVVSDHGMNHTERFVSYNHLLHRRGFGSEYLVALDSTMVRLWYFDRRAYSPIHTIVEESDNGEFLTMEQLKELGVHFPGQEYYHEVYLLRPGLSIFPNYHSYLRPMAMHAYHPEIVDQLALAQFSGQRLSALRPPPDGIHIVDIMPTVSKLLGLNHPSVAGHSVV